MCNPNPNPNPNPSSGTEEKARGGSKQALVEEVARKLSNGDPLARVQAARDIRRLARASAKTRSIFAVDTVVQPLVSMLRSSDPEPRKSALLALLNIAVRNERNKDTIVKSGAVPRLVELLRSEDTALKELAAAAVLTLSASTSSKPTIASSGAVPLLVGILISGSIQGKVDAVTALYNLSSCNESANSPISAEAIKPLLGLLKDCKKYSKFAEKATALLEILSGSEESGRFISETDGGILVLIETVEDGSSLSMEHAAGVLLALCKSCREKYRELILNEGAIPGLLLLTVEGTRKAQERARELLVLLRDDSRMKTVVGSKDLATIVYDIASRVDDSDKSVETARRLLQDVVQRPRP